MKLFGKNKRNIWTPSWEYKANGMFWRMKISEDGRIVCEIRDPEKKKAWFNCVSEISGEVIWNNFRFEEDWWVGIEDIMDGIAYFHKFRKPDMPQHAEITAVDIATGKPLWENKEVSFLFADANGVYASKPGFESRKFFRLDTATGEIVEELGIDPGKINELRSTLNDEYMFRNYRYPVHFDSNHEHYKELENVVSQHVESNSLRGNLDVLVENGYAFICCHETTKQHTELSPHLDQRFVAVEIAMNSVICEDTINAGVQAPAFDSFFAKDNRLFYIKNRHILTVYELPSA